MESEELRTGLSAGAIVAIVCNSVVGVLILVLFAILYRACQVPSKCPDKMAVILKVPEENLERQGSEQKYLLTEA